MKQVEGYVERITYRNEENGYSVIYLPSNLWIFHCLPEWMQCVIILLMKWKH